MSLIPEEKVVLKSKEEQDFWDKVFLSAIWNNTGGLAANDADLAIALRRSREVQPPITCGKVHTTLTAAIVCQRKPLHPGRCRNWE